MEKQRKILKQIEMVAFACYIFLMLYLVFFMRTPTTHRFNLIPFYTFYKVFETGNFFIIIVNILGNFFFFMPLDYYLIKFFKIKSLKANILASFLSILVIEVLQFVFRVGVFDVDDLILCTFGMALFGHFYNKIGSIRCELLRRLPLRKVDTI
ncbi:MAG: VanZ family protein [Lachnospiraceae bacterium]|nr:VanZ family protein [Lachnospiraceae bacterium]